MPFHLLCPEQPIKSISGVLFPTGMGPLSSQRNCKVLENHMILYAGYMVSTTSLLILLQVSLSRQYEILLPT